MRADQRGAWAVGAVVVLTATVARAAPGAAGAAGAAATAAAAGGAADEILGRPLALVVALALLSLLPFVFMSLTAFVKISTVLQIVRGAIGAQGVPSGTVVTALAAALSVLAMTPTLTRIADRAAPLLEGPAGDSTALVRAGVDAVREPLRDFLRANADLRERERFAEVARRAAAAPGARGATAGPAGAAGGPAVGGPAVGAGPVVAAGPDDLVVLGPAFLATELREAFALGFALYLPFLVIDLVVANVLLALGMSQLQPTQVSLPFKLLLFVGIDGWGLLAQSLVSGYLPG